MSSEAKGPGGQFPAQILMKVPACGQHTEDDVGERDPEQGEPLYPKVKNHRGAQMSCVPQSEEFLLSKGHETTRQRLTWERLVSPVQYVPQTQLCHK